MIRMENLLLSVPTDEDLRRAYYEDTQAFLQRQRARIQVGGWMCVGGRGELSWVVITNDEQRMRGFEGANDLYTTRS